MLKKRLKTVLAYATPYKKFVVLNVVCNVLSTIFSLFSLTMIIPFLKVIFSSQEDFTNLLVDPEEASTIDLLMNHVYGYMGHIVTETGSKLSALIFVCILVVTTSLLKNKFKYFASFFLAGLRVGVIKDLRNKVYKKIIKLPISFYSEERKGDIMSRMTSDIQEIEWSVIRSLEMIFRDPINIIMFLITMFLFNFELTLLSLVVLPIAGILIGIVGKRLKEKALIAQQKIGNILSIIEETLSGIKVIQAFVAEKQMFKEFNERNESYRRTVLKVYRIRDLASPLSEFLASIVVSFIMFYGGSLAINQQMEPENFIAYIIIFSQIITPAKSMTSTYYDVQKGIASIKRINEIINADISIKDNDNPSSINEFKTSIQYKDVSFHYEENKPVLKNINFEINKGDTIALVGESGGGKSTLADLLPRFYDCTSGEIMLDGKNLKDYKVKDIRAIMGVVTQQSILFNDTVFNNITLGIDNAKKDDVYNAAKIANAHEFIEQMENGYNTYVGDGGCKLSGGQRQRLTIARAILKNPPILVLDEATSALDTESERLVQDALIKLMENRTSIVIAHRLSTIQNSDKIYVIQKGEFVESGSHSELLEKNGVYKKLHGMQMFN